jgi:hypothetical protein|tara:strand:- start:884 stop:1132 length:249 start_codon:yes stop_codon:yes gene_type:complete
MIQAIRKYKGLVNKELTVAYRKISRDLDRAYSKALGEAERMADAMEEHKPSNIKKLEKLDEVVNSLQTELDAIGMLKTGRFC